jgi:hypothetical protein
MILPENKYPLTPLKKKFTDGHRIFAFKQVDTQWIKNATAQQAKDSFLRID